MRHPSISPRGDRAAARPAPDWLEAQVYAPRRQRTVQLTERSIAALRAVGQRVSLTRIVAQSKQLDPTGRGVSASAILRNPGARAQYERQRTATGPPRRGRPPGRAATRPAEIRVAPDRDLARARRRYLRQGKAALVERLLAVEQAYAEQEARWRQVNDDLLVWQLRARAAEAHAASPPQSPPAGPDTPP